MTTYVPQYEANDVADVTIDLIVAIGAFAVSFATLIGLVMLFRWLRANVPALR